MNKNISAGRSGQILPGAIAILVILAVMVPAMVLWTQREAVYSMKQSQNTSAFHLAEAGVEKGYLYVSLSTITWNAIQAGTSQANYRFDKAYTDIEGGTYAISITSGPGTQQVTIITVGRDRRNTETRALRVVYTNAILGDTAIYSGGGVQIGGGTNVEWGAVMSPNNIIATGRAHPQYWSASQIIGKDTSANPPNSDGCQWHSFQANLPTPPDLDFDFYRTSAAATTGCPDHVGAHGALRDGTLSPGSCYYPGAVTNWNDTTASKTIFIEGDLTVKSNGMFHTGTIVVMGNINLPNGVWGTGNVTMSMPNKAWKQYCNDWAAYLNFDPSPPAPANYPGLNSTYTSSSLITKFSSKVAVNGFMYVGGNFNNGGGGGGNSDIYGVLYAIGTSTLSAASPIDFYYNGGATSNIVTTNVSLTRASWQDEVRGWPAGL